MIQEIFAFLFSAEGGDEVASSLDDVNKKSKEVVTSNKQLSDSFVSLTTSVISITAAWKAWSSAMNITNQNDQLYLMQEMTGIGARTLAELGLASEQFGGNINTASHALMGLERNIMQLRKTGSGPLMQAGMWYGLNISSDPEKMLRNISKRMESLPRRMKFDLGRMLGLDNATIMLLGKGVANLEKELKRAKEYTFVDEKKVEQSHELKKAMSEMGYIIGGIGIDIMATISPHVKSIVDFLKDSVNFLREHKEFVAAIAISVVSIWTTLGGWKTLLSAIKIMLSGLTFTAIVAAIEDIYGYFTGTDSVLGEILEKMPQLKERVDAIGSSIKNAWGYISSDEAIKDIENAINTIINKWQTFKKWWTETTVEQKINDIVTALKEFNNWLGIVSVEGWEKVTDSFVKFKNVFNDWWENSAKPFYETWIKPLVDLIATISKFSWDWGKGKVAEKVSDETNQIKWGLAFDYAANDRLPGLSNNGLPDSVAWRRDELNKAAIQQIKREGEIEHLEALALTDEMRQLVDQIKLYRHMDTPIGAGTINTRNALDTWRVLPILNSTNDNPLNANVEINIMPQSMDMLNAEAIGRNVGEGFLNSIGTYASGRR